MAIVHGKSGAVKIGSPTGVLVAAMNEWTITSTADEEDVTSFGDTDKSWLAGFKDNQVRVNGFYDAADAQQSALHDAFAEGSEVHVQLYTQPNSGFEFDGVVLSREISASVNGAVTCNFGFRANGAIEEFTITP